MHGAVSERRRYGSSLMGTTNTNTASFGDEPPPAAARIGEQWQPPRLATNHRDACLRVLHLSQSLHLPIYEASVLEAFGWRGSSGGLGSGGGGGSSSSSPWTDAFLLARLRASHESRVDAVHVYRDFVRLHKQLRGTPDVVDPRPLLPSARSVFQVAQHAVVLSSLSACGSYGNYSGDLVAFLHSSLRRLVDRSSADLVSVKDWALLWDTSVGSAFVLPVVPTALSSDTNGTVRVGDDVTRPNPYQAAGGYPPPIIAKATTTAAASALPSAIQLERTAWKLACVRSQQQQQQQQQQNQPPPPQQPQRRVRLVAACGALAFVAALYDDRIQLGPPKDPEDFFEQQQEEEDVVMEDVDDGAGSEDRKPPAKRTPREETNAAGAAAVPDKLAGAVASAVWTPRWIRYGVVHSMADALAVAPGRGREVTASEIVDEARAVAGIVWDRTAARAAESRRGGGGGAGDAAADAGSVLRPSTVPWLRELEAIRRGDDAASPYFVTARHVAARLLRTAEELYQDEILQVTSSNDDGFVYDVGTLVELDSLEALDESNDDLQARARARLERTFASRMASVVEGERGTTADRRGATAPAYTEAMELNEWAVSLVNRRSVDQTPKLMALVQMASPGASAAHVVPAVNRVLGRIGQEFVTEGKPTRHTAVLVEPLGGIYLSSAGLTSDKRFVLALVALYYHALEAILYCDRHRHGCLVQSKQWPGEFINSRKLITDPNFHAAVLACCLLCVHRGLGATQKIVPMVAGGAVMSAFSALHVCDCPPDEFLAAAERFRESLMGSSPARGRLGSALPFDIPRVLWREFRRAERNVIDTFLWRGEIKSFSEKLEELRERRSWPPDCLAPSKDDDDGDESSDTEDDRTKPDDRDNESSDMLSYVFRRVLDVSRDRIASLLDFVRVQPRELVVHQVMVALRYLLRRHVDLLYDRHLDHMILCCLYGVGKQLGYQPEITFAKLIDAYVVVRGEDEGDITCQRVVRHIKLFTDADRKDEEPVGNIIQLYNRVFVPRMKDYLLGNASLRRAAASLASFKSSASGPSRAVGVPGSIQVTIRDAPGAALRDHMREGGSVAVFEFGRASSSAAAAEANDMVSEQPPDDGASAASED